MFARSTEARTRELRRLCPLFTDWTQEGDKPYGKVLVKVVIVVRSNLESLSSEPRSTCQSPHMVEDMAVKRPAAGVPVDDGAPDASPWPCLPGDGYQRERSDRILDGDDFGVLAKDVFRHPALLSRRMEVRACGLDTPTRH